MLIINNNSYGINEIIINFDEFNKVSVDSILLIPGVTIYKNIYSIKNSIILDNGSSFTQVNFNSNSDVIRFYTTIMREIKLNQILNVDIKKD